MASSRRISVMSAACTRLSLAQRCPEPSGSAGCISPGKSRRAWMWPAAWAAECHAGRSAAGEFRPGQAGAECRGEAGDHLAAGLVADVLGEPGAGEVSAGDVGAGAGGGQAFL